MADFIDVAIIGGGPAGLTAAATLARQLHTAVNKNPQEFHSSTKSDIISRYSSIRFVDIAVAKIEKKSDAHFTLLDADGKEWTFRKVILAVGSSDTYPDIEGYAELWTKRIFHCLFCYGYEDRGASSSGVLGVFPIVIPALVIHMAENAAQLSDTVTLYTHGNEELTAQLQPVANSKFKIEARQIKRLVDNPNTGSVTVEHVDGTQKEEKFLVHNPLTSVQGPFVAQLGITLTPMGDINADAPAHQTSVRGGFAAGDCITPYKVIPGAISSGCNAAVAASTQLQAEKYGQTPMF
ncbi:FAD/NAD(P)-binding domain-containing protein [Xylaria longipes]|nr:FAD/NAD(P)-binding domain-containing protein [Xylaria longipes]